MRASLIILVWNGKPYLEACLDAVLAQEYPGFEVIVVDNASTDGSADWVAEHYPQVRLIRNAINLGFAGGNNVGLAAAAGDVLALLNQDTMVQPGWLAALVEALQTYPGAGVAGAKILDMDGRVLQHAGGHIRRPLALGWHYGHGEIDSEQWDEPREVEFVTGASLAMKREVYAKIGGLDESFFPGYFEDVDFCYRARAAGFAVWYAPQARMLHHESASMRRDSFRGHCSYYCNRLRFVFKHDTIASIVSEFIPAEIERLALIQLDELRASIASTVEGIVFWPEVAAQRSSPPTAEEHLAVQSALRDLYNAAVRRAAELGVESAAIAATPAPAPDADAQYDVWFAGELPQQIHIEYTSLNDGVWKVTPRPFVSSTPVIGPLSVRFRNILNDLATRWYVDPILEQQVVFNANVVRLLNAQHDQHRQIFRDVAYNEQRHEVLLQNHLQQIQYHAQQIQDQARRDLTLAEQVAALQQRVLALQSRVNQLEESLDERRK
ncbi:MAG: glycosyltransferase [Anaerolineae bacterium]|nr:glycosyltransferase [Anaerolineae bacterium]